MAVPDAAGADRRGSDPATAANPAVTLGGRYELRRLVARGGMAEVWEGYDTTLSRAVAVKVLPSHLATDRSFVDRFHREAVTAARLGHPSVVATYDTGVDRGTPYIVMELVRGQTLRDLLNSTGALDPEVAVGIARQIADALAHAHRAGLVHRDIKPANVLLFEEETGPPQVKVADFGIAKASTGVGEDLTVAGTVLGTPKYLSPEQVRGDEEPDTRSDLYSLGVVTFEMLTGRPPLVGGTEMATALAHLNDRPPTVSSLVPAIPASLDALVDALLAKDPADRPPTAVAVRQALEVVARELAERRAAARPGPRRRPDPTNPGRPVPTERRPPAVAGAVGATWAGGPAATTTLEPGRRPRPAPAPAAPPPRRRPSRLPGLMVGSLILAGAVVAGVLVLRPGHGTRTATPPTPLPAALPISTARVWMYNGDPPDNPTTAPLAVDGVPTDVWSTDVYYGPGGATFNHLYPGIGLAIELRRPARVVRLTVSSPTVGWSASTYVSATAVASGSGLAGWGTPTATRTDIDGDTTFNLGGRRGRWILLWLTDIGPAHRAEVGDITVR